MAQLIVGVAIGAVLGGAFATLLMRARRSDGSELATARERAASADARIADLTATIARERQDHSVAIEQLGERFKVLAGDALGGVADQFGKNQSEFFELRERQLNERLEPLRELLGAYQARVEKLEAERAKGFTDVEEAARKLADAQALSLEETRKLNTILGRASTRGRWGEIQLERILEQAQMQAHIDFTTQSTVSDGDSRSRPDVIVKLPKGAVIVIDAKTPYDAFDRAMEATNDTDRELAMKEFAASMRSHVNELKRRDYTKSVAVTPEMTVCFVPSDYLLSAAFSADPALLDDALGSRVLIAGPTSLLGLLLAVALGWSHFEAANSMAEITELASKLIDRTATVYEHVQKLGGHLEKSAKSYNAMIGSMERNFISTARRLQEKGIRAQKSLEEPEELDLSLSPPNSERWGVAQLGPPVLDAEIIEPDSDDE